MKKCIFSFLISTLVLLTMGFASTPAKAPQQIPVTVFVPTTPYKTGYCFWSNPDSTKVWGCTINQKTNGFYGKKMYEIKVNSQFRISKMGVYIPIYSSLPVGVVNFKLFGCSDTECTYTGPDNSSFIIQLLTT